MARTAIAERRKTQDNVHEVQNARRSPSNGQANTRKTTTNVGEGAREGAATLGSFVEGGSALRSNPLPFCIPL